MTISTTMAPNTTIARVQNQFDRILETSRNTSMLPVRMHRKGFMMPSLNVYEDASTIYVETELPGVPLDDVDVTVVGQQLTITGRRTLLVPDEAAIVAKERGSLKFQRSVMLSVPVIEEEIQVSMHRGILTVSMPKMTWNTEHRSTFTA
ncbi:MAG: Hsp20/alpha crystallin family protein [Planctomycetota bacterium]|nr:Hsp20/alpha crystallin family protein [Planctomycetota bacterium]